MRMTHDEMVAVILAHKAGKKIEYRGRGETSWGTADNPCWDFQSFEYRIAPEPKYRPWRKPEEVPVGTKIKNKKTECSWRITSVEWFGPGSEMTIKIGGYAFSPGSVFEAFIGLNGSPCGVKEE